MIEIINPKAENYADTFSSNTDELLREIETLNETQSRSTMLSGPVQGKLLELLSIALKPERILEVGTFLGYSALCMAKGLRAGGTLHTLELSKESADTAERFFAKSSQYDQIILHRGIALELIPAIDEAWDLVFIDADKVNYINYYELTLPRLKKGGVILADNVLFHGEVLEDEISGKYAKAINAFNEHVAADARVEQVMMTIRDGLMFIVKK
ncbi:MAG: O-methyltransferase [Ginsengibacter sp.]